MGRREFFAWIKRMREDAEANEAGPDSWRGVENDQWWQEVRRKRDEMKNR